MSKVLLFSDLHVHPHKRSMQRMEDCLAVLNWVFATAKSHGITDILFGGDLFHDRQRIDIPTYQRTFETLQSNLVGEKFRLWLLLGNHDMWFNDNTSSSSVIPLQALPGIRVIDKPCRREVQGVNWDFVPFTHNPVQSLQDIQQSSGEAKYCLAHVAMHGAILHGQHTSDVIIEHDGDMVTVDAAIFQNYQQVFLGHYHAEQRLSDTVEYIGSGMELSFGEAYQQKHIILFDQETREKEYVVNKFSPKHLVIPEKDVDASANLLDGNFIRIVVDDVSTSNLVELRQKVVSNNKLGSLEIKPRRKREEELRVVQDAKAILKDDQLLDRYLDESGTDGLDRNVLLKIGQKICGKTA